MYFVRMSDQTGNIAVDFKLNHNDVNQHAIDFVFDVVGAEPSRLIQEQVIEQSAAHNLRALQNLIFDEDEDGKLIRHGVRIMNDGEELNPDLPLKEAFRAASSKNGVANQCVLSVEALPQAASTIVPLSLAKMFFVNQIEEGRQLDVIAEHPELVDLIHWAEREHLIEIDVKRAAYRLTADGKRLYKQQHDEAQELIRRFDIFGDVDVDANGRIHFDSGLGRDFRVPVWELEDIDPFRARFLLGMNDGEWKEIDWMSAIVDPGWYEQVFRPVEQAPSIQEIGEQTLSRVIEQGKRRLRNTMESADRENWG